MWLVLCPKTDRNELKSQECFYSAQRWREVFISSAASRYSRLKRVAAFQMAPVRLTFSTAINISAIKGLSRSIQNLLSTGRQKPQREQHSRLLFWSRDRPGAPLLNRSDRTINSHFTRLAFPPTGVLTATLEILNTCPWFHFGNVIATIKRMHKYN